MDTSIFAFLAALPRPKRLPPNSYVQSWYSKQDYPVEFWDVRDQAGGGYWRYAKYIPFHAVSGPEDITFPAGEIFVPQIDWSEPTKYVPAGGRDG